MSGEQASSELNTDNTDATGFSQMAVVTTPSHRGRARSSEEALKQRSTPEGAEVNVLLCLGRGALPSATRGPAGEGSVLL